MKTSFSEQPRNMIDDLNFREGYSLTCCKVSLLNK
jgi:hypothetical protein